MYFETRILPSIYQRSNKEKRPRLSELLIDFMSNGIKTNFQISQSQSQHYIVYNSDNNAKCY